MNLANRKYSVLRIFTNLKSSLYVSLRIVSLSVKLAFKAKFTVAYFVVSLLAKTLKHSIAYSTAVFISYLSVRIDSKHGMRIETNLFGIFSLVFLSFEAVSGNYITLFKTIKQSLSILSCSSKTLASFRLSTFKLISFLMISNKVSWICS